jgi:hypothetical protein
LRQQGNHRDATAGCRKISKCPGNRFGSERKSADKSGQHSTGSNVEFWESRAIERQLSYIVEICSRVPDPRYISELIERFLLEHLGSVPSWRIAQKRELARQRGRAALGAFGVPVVLCGVGGNRGSCGRRVVTGDCGTGKHSPECGGKAWYVQFTVVDSGARMMAARRPAVGRRSWLAGWCGRAGGVGGAAGPP